MADFLTNIRERKLVRWTLFYLAFAWGSLQVLDFFGNHFGWSNRVVPFATVILATGLVAMLILAWYHGEKGRQQVSRIEVLLLIATIALGGTGMFAVRHQPARTADGADGGATGDIAYTAVSEASVAVLPFVNLSGLKDNEYFSDGITEEILNALAKISGLRVAGRTGAFAMRADTADLVAVGRKLGVAHLLMGSVQRVGNDARVQVKLVDTRSDSVQWSDKYDRKLSDIFAVEDEISRSIAQELRAHIGTNVVLNSSSTESVDAHDLYLLGLARWNTRNVADLHKALEYFTAAVEKDSSYAQAWAGIALARAVLPQYDSRVNARTSAEAARAAAQRALRIDPNCAEAHAALSQVAEFDNALATGEREARQAVRLKPSYMTAHQWLAEILYLQNRKPEAFAEIDSAIAIDRLSAVALQMRATFLSGSGRTDDALRTLDAMLVIDSTFSQARDSRSTILLHNGRLQAALDFGLRGAQSSRDSSDIRAIVAGFSRPSDRPRAVALLRSGRGAAMGLSDYDIPALLYAMGAHDEAFTVVREMASDPNNALYIRFQLLSEGNRGMYDDPRLPAAFKPGLGR